MLRHGLLIILALGDLLWSQKLLIPMDNSQRDHLKAYGVTFWTLRREVNVEWLLNYRGGSFLIDALPEIQRECQIRGVTTIPVDAAQLGAIFATIEQSNMDIVLLEKSPRIAVYSPPNKQPWDDAVTLALTYAEVPYAIIYDEDILAGGLSRYDWVHLHHEDFTGQHGKFWNAYRNVPWYRQQELETNTLARKLGFNHAPALKRAVAVTLKNYVVQGGFLFAMCSATDSWDIALAAQDFDMVDTPFDGTPPDRDVQNRLDFSKGVAFENYRIFTDPALYEYATIDIPASYASVPRSADNDYFTLFEFAAKYDPVPTMLTQNHVGVIKGFMGQTTNFRRSTLKKSVVILGEREGTEEVRYIHGNLGQGTFTFLGGHDPEDYQHFVGDPPTNLALHPNSPGYRLILNNILFPAARKKERKT
ncbi:MAG: asparagine synthetase B [Candidatus Marinimicrobia bacterium]|nr:asparagine synthetase B [Candidatus Neomarinimicrobiota bacterium]